MSLEQRTSWFSRYRNPLAFLLVAVAATAATVYGFRRLQESIVPEVDRSLRAVVPAAEWVQVFRAQPKVEIPITRFGPAADEDPEMFALFRSETRYGAQPSPSEPDLYFNVRFHPKGAGPGRVTRYGYDLETGLLGRDNDWAVVPNQFRMWMRKMDARVPHKEYGIMRSEGRKVIAPMPDQPEDQSPDQPRTDR